MRKSKIISALMGGKKLSTVVSRLDDIIDCGDGTVSGLTIEDNLYVNFGDDLFCVSVSCTGNATVEYTERLDNGDCEFKILGTHRECVKDVKTHKMFEVMYGAAKLNDLIMKLTKPTWM